MNHLFSKYGPRPSSHFSADLVIFTEEICNRKLQFFVQGLYILIYIDTYVHIIHIY